jgi:hypothetical protein
LGGLAVCCVTAGLLLLPRECVPVANLLTSIFESTGWNSFEATVDPHDALEYTSLLWICYAVFCLIIAAAIVIPLMVFLRKMGNPSRKIQYDRKP